MTTTIDERPWRTAQERAEWVENIGTRLEALRSILKFKLPNPSVDGRGVSDWLHQSAELLDETATAAAVEFSDIARDIHRAVAHILPAQLRAEEERLRREIEELQKERDRIAKRGADGQRRFLQPRTDEERERIARMDKKLTLAQRAVYELSKEIR